MKTNCVEPKIIVTLTTWKGRINKIPQLLDNLMQCTKLPDKIVINLAFEEFYKDDVVNIPIEVVEAFEKYKNILDIHWVKHNTKVWKKLIPTLLRYPNDIIISIDDDFAYPLDFIETLYNDFIKNEMQNPISGNDVVLPGNNMVMHQYHCGCCSLVMYKFFKDNLNLLTPEIYNIGSDDVYYTNVVNRCGYEYGRSSKMYFTNMQSTNDEDDIGYSLSTGVHNHIADAVVACVTTDKQCYTDEVINYIIEEP